MAWRLRLAPEKTNIDFFALQWITFGLSAIRTVGEGLVAQLLVERDAAPDKGASSPADGQGRGEVAVVIRGVEHRGR